MLVGAAWRSSDTTCGSTIDHQSLSILLRPRVFVAAECTSRPQERDQVARLDAVAVVALRE